MDTTQLRVIFLTCTNVARSFSVITWATPRSCEVCIDTVQNKESAESVLHGEGEDSAGLVLYDVEFVYTY